MSLTFNKRRISWSSKYFPDYLKTIPNPPKQLFCKGNISVLINNRICAVVGTRKPSQYGLECVDIVVKGIARTNGCVVSGMALGIDARAHMCAIEYNLPTVAVLANGVDSPYPKQNTKLYHSILTSGGLIISEMPQKSILKPWHFVLRNRIISGLARICVVVQGGPTSGTLTTARYAAQQGRVLAAVPGNIDDMRASAPNVLIQNGAHPILTSNDIYDLIKGAN